MQRTNRAYQSTGMVRFARGCDTVSNRKTKHAQKEELAIVLMKIQEPFSDSASMCMASLRRGWIAVTCAAQRAACAAKAEAVRTKAARNVAPEKNRSLESSSECIFRQDQRKLLAAERVGGHVNHSLKHIIFQHDALSDVSAPRHSPVTHLPPHPPNPQRDAFQLLHPANPPQESVESSATRCRSSGSTSARRMLSL